MKFQMRIRSIPATSVAVKQSIFLSAIGGLNSDWGIESPHALAPEFGAELSAFFPLGKQLGKGGVLGKNGHIGNHRRTVRKR